MEIRFGGIQTRPQLPRTPRGWVQLIVSAIVFLPAMAFWVLALLFVVSESQTAIFGGFVLGAITAGIAGWLVSVTTF